MTQISTQQKLIQNNEINTQVSELNCLKYRKKRRDSMSVSEREYDTVQTLET